MIELLLLGRVWGRIRSGSAAIAADGAGGGPPRPLALERDGEEGGLDMNGPSSSAGMVGSVGKPVYGDGKGVRLVRLLCGVEGGILEEVADDKTR